MLRTLLLVLVMLSVSSIAMADLKIGVINPGKVMENAPQAAAARAKLESEFSTRSVELEAMQKEYLDLEESFNRDGLLMTEVQRSEKARDLQNRQRDIKRFQDDFRDDLDSRRNEELGVLQRTIYEAMLTLAEREGYDLILSEGVAFASDKVDLTDKLIEQLSTPSSSPELKK